MKIKAKSSDEYILKLPDERKEVVRKIRDAIRENIPDGFEEGMNYNMIGFYVPHSKYPKGYHSDPKQPLPFINLASQKNYIALYHNGMYADPQLQNWFEEEYPKHAKYKLDMGKSCIRFKRMDDIPYQLIGELVSKITVDEWIKIYEKNINK